MRCFNKSIRSLSADFCDVIYGIELFRDFESDQESSGLVDGNIACSNTRDLLLLNPQRRCILLLRELGIPFFFPDAHTLVLLPLGSCVASNSHHPCCSGISCRHFLSKRKKTTVSCQYVDGVFLHRDIRTFIDYLSLLLSNHPRAYHRIITRSFWGEYPILDISQNPTMVHFRLGVFLISIGLLSMQSLDLLLAKDYRAEVLGWKKMRRELPDDGRNIGLTHDYNTRLRYYGCTHDDQWPHATDFEMHVLAGGNYDPSDPAVIRGFINRTEGYDYFLVTLFDELEQQSALNSFLYKTYPFTDGDGYILFHLAEKGR